LDGRAVPIKAVPRIHNPGDQLWCPGILWEVNGNFYASHEADCTPYEQLPEGERGTWPVGQTDEAKLIWLTRGEYRITAKFQKSGHTLGRAECQVTIE
jgi:hypothetical protein